jgi:hypothetical protein
MSKAFYRCMMPVGSAKTGVRLIIKSIDKNNNV